MVENILLLFQTEKYSWDMKRNQSRKKHKDTKHKKVMKKQKILIVEDETIIAVRLKNLIQRLGPYECVTVSSGEYAVELSRTFDPHLILMDINLNGQINGIEAAKQIRSSNDVPVVFISAYNDEETMKEAGQASPAGYLTKPFYARAVEKIVTSLLDKEIQFSANYEVQNTRIK